MQLKGVTIQWQEMAEGRSLVTKAAPTELTTWSTENVIDNNDKLNANQLRQWHFPFTPFLPQFLQKKRKKKGRKSKKLIKNEWVLIFSWILNQIEWFLWGANFQHFILSGGFDVRWKISFSRLYLKSNLASSKKTSMTSGGEALAQSRQTAFLVKKGYNGTLSWRLRNSKLSGWQDITLKYFPDRARKSFFAITARK